MNTGTKDHTAPVGWQVLRDELYRLVHKKRPEVVQVVNWVVGNDDRSESEDHLYGKRRMREIDRHIRFLTKRLEAAIMVDPEQREPTKQVFFGMTICLLHDDGSEQTVRIVSADEIGTAQNRISWISPLAHCLIKTHKGDKVVLDEPGGRKEIEILSMKYIRVD